MRILADPNRLEALARQFSHASDDLDGISSRISSAIGALDWDARNKAGVDGYVTRARSMASHLAQQADQMARYLTAKAHAFDQADHEGVGAVGQIAGTFADFQKQWAQLPGGSKSGLTKEQFDMLVRLGLLTDDQKVAGSSAQFDPNIALVPASILLAGGATFLGRLNDMRELLPRDLKPYGRLLNDLVGNKHAGWVGRMDKLGKFLPKLGYLDPLLEFVGEGDYSTRGAIIAGATSGVTALAAYAIPGLGTALAISAGVQLAGGLAMWGLEAAGHKEWADKGRDVLDAVDAHKYVRQGAEWFVDQSAAAWQLSGARRILDLGNFVPEWRVN